jgi:hypothetical protein
MQQLKDGEAGFIKTLEIQDIFLLSSNHKLFHLYSEQKMSINFDKVGDINVTTGENFVVFEIEAIVNIYDNEKQEEDDSKTLLSSKAKFGAIYSFDPKALGDSIEHLEDFAIHFFQYGAIAHVLAYAREYFSNIITRSGYPRFVIPLIKTELDKDGEEHALKAIEEVSKN